MTATYLTPGVYVEELPAGSVAIEGVGTSVTLFMGYALSGPVGTAVRIASWGEFERRFGGVSKGEVRGVNDLRAAHVADRKVPDVDYMGHAVFAYFQNGGGVAYVCRLAEGDDPSLANGTTLTKASSTVVTPTLVFTAIDPGSWANGLIVEVAPDEAHPPNHVVVVSRKYARGRTVALERFDDIELLAGGDKFLGRVLEQRSRLIRLDPPPTRNPQAPLIDPEQLHGVHLSGAFSADDRTALDLGAADEAARTLKVQLTPTTTANTVAVVAQKVYPDFDALAAELQTALRLDRSDGGVPGGARDQVTVTVIRDGANRRMEVRSGQGDPKSKAIVSDTGLGVSLKFAPADATDGLQSFNAAVAAEGKATAKAVLFGGADGYLPQSAAPYVEALESLELNPDINVIATPNAAWDDSGREAVNAVVAHCERMRNRVAIIDPPSGAFLNDPTKVNSLALPTSTYAQLYYPWVTVANPVHHPVTAPGAPATVLVPPSGFAAGMWARIDGRRGAWKAPAGVEALLIGADGFAFDVGDRQQEVLNPLGVNALRMKPGYGRVIWGARTLATNASPEWRYISVRRTAIMIEESIRRGIQWAVFEPNRDTLWSSLRLSAESFMSGLFRSGAFQGSVASQAYQVECGLGTTMEQGDIDRGYVILKVKFAPLKPAEFVVIQIQQLAGQA